jgi:hypothetical protein
MTYYAAKIYVNEIGFHATAPSPLELMSGQSSRRPWYHAHARNESLIRCLEASVEYLDCVISLPSEEMLSFTLPDFVRLIYATLVLGRYTTGVDAPTLDAAHVRKTANLGYYLDALSGRTKALIRLAGDQGRRCYIHHLSRLFERLRVWYSQVINAPASADSYLLFAPELTFMQILPAATDCCVDISDTDGSYQDWSYVFSEWTSSLDPSAMSLDREVE